MSEVTVEVTVTEITIQLADGSTVAMSVNDAKALHRSLNELFGKASISSTPTVIVKETRPRWYDDGRIPLSSTHTLESPHPYPTYPQVWCKSL